MPEIDQYRKKSVINDSQLSLNNRFRSQRANFSNQFPLHIGIFVNQYFQSINYFFIQVKLWPWLTIDSFRISHFLCVCVVCKKLCKKQFLQKSHSLCASSRSSASFPVKINQFCVERGWWSIIDQYVVMCCVWCDVWWKILSSSRTRCDATHTWRVTLPGLGCCSDSDMLTVWVVHENWSDNEKNELYILNRKKENVCPAQAQCLTIDKNLITWW